MKCTSGATKSQDQITLPPPTPNTHILPLLARYTVTCTWSDLWTACLLLCCYFADEYFKLGTVPPRYSQSIPFSVFLRKFPTGQNWLTRWLGMPRGAAIVHPLVWALHTWFWVFPTAPINASSHSHVLFGSLPFAKQMAGGCLYILLV